MGQQLPIPNGQNPYGPGLPSAVPGLASSFPAMPGMPQHAAGQPGGIPGVDPRMMQQAQQSLANPNGGDVVAPFGGPGSLLPGPKELGLGALAGVGASGLFQVMDSGKFHGLELFKNEPKLFDKAAIGLDKITLGSRLAKVTDQPLKDIKQPWLRELLISDATVTPAELEKLTKGLSPQAAEKFKAEHIEKAVNTAVNKMEKRHFEKVVDNFQNQFERFKKKHPSMAADYEKLVKEAGGHNYLKDGIPKIPVDGARHVISNPQKFDEGLGGFKAAMEQVTKDKFYLEGEPYEVYTRFLRYGNENFKKEARKHWATYFEQKNPGALGDLTRQFHYLDDKLNKTKAEAALCKLLRQTKESAGGVANHFTPLYKSQAKLTAELSAQGIGPVGRSVRSFANYLQRIMSGETAGMARKGSAGLLSKASGALGPALMGALLFGFSFQSAKNAQPGERKQAFWHNLLGQQIFNFIGWEFGRKLLYAMNFKKLLGRFAKTTPLAYLRHIPFVGKLIGGVSLGGIATELTAMLVFGSLAQKVGEKISHMIFGKPSQASIDGKPSIAAATGVIKPQLPGQPQIPGQPQAATGQTQNQNPALSGAFNPALMNAALVNSSRNPAMPAAGLPARSSIPGGAAQNPAYGPGAPGAGMSPPTAPQGIGNAMPAGMNSAAAPKAPTAPQVQQQPPQPQFSLSPAEISRSKVANDYNVYFNKLKADKSLDQRTGEILDKLDRS